MSCGWQEHKGNSDVQQAAAALILALSAESELPAV